jgi:hypothetical protein
LDSQKYTKIPQHSAQINSIASIFTLTNDEPLANFNSIGETRRILEAIFTGFRDREKHRPTSNVASYFYLKKKIHFASSR